MREPKIVKLKNITCENYPDDFYKNGIIVELEIEFKKGIRKYRLDLPDEIHGYLYEFDLGGNKTFARSMTILESLFAYEIFKLKEEKQK